MPERPSQLWKDMPSEKRLRAAEAFWRDAESPDIQVQHMEVIGTLARRLKFRTRSIQALPVERKAHYLAQLPDVSDTVAMRALIAYHFADQRPLMGAFLDGLGLAHDNGLITAEDVPPPDADRLAAAVDLVRGAGQFTPADVTLYLRTLASLDAETWANVETVLQRTSA
jgi:hypothetical protein